MPPTREIAGAWDSQGRPLYVEPPGWRSWKRWVIVAAVVGFLSLATWVFVFRPIHREAQRRAALANFALMYKAFIRDYGNSPASFEEMSTFIESNLDGPRGDSCRSARLALEMVRLGKLNVVWKGNPNSSWNVYLAYEPAASMSGGLIVRPNATVEWVNDIQFARMWPCDQW